MRAVASILVCVLGALTHPAFGQGLCSSQEITFLSCTTKNGKMLSVCASRDLAVTTGYLQYRYGRPEAVELAFPEDKSASQGKFKWRTDPHADVVANWLIFYREKYKYTVFSIQDSDTLSGRGKRREGVIVTNPKGHESTISCASVSEDRLDGLAGILPPASDEE